MRLFTGIALPPATSAAVMSLLDRLRPCAHLTWTRVDKLHITTRFIGEWSENGLPELERALASISAPDPIEIRFGELGWLPDGRQPHTLHLAVIPTEPLKRLATATDLALLNIGLIPEPRVYRPHVTLGRVRRNQHEPLGALRAEIKDLTFDISAFTAPAFHLYLSAEGTYTKLKDFPLTA